jgi:hypothetical protein
MQTFHVSWPRGTIELELKPGAHTDQVYHDVAQKAKLAEDDFELYVDAEFRKLIPRQRQRFMNLRIKSGSTFYMKVLIDLPEEVVRQDAAATDLNREYLGDKEKPTIGMRSVQDMYGSRAVGIAHFEHRNALRPRLGDQTCGSCYAVRVGQEVLKPLMTAAVRERFSVHRVIFLFGRIDVVPGKVTVHASYAPRCTCTAHDFTLANADELDLPSAVAKVLGMQVVGMAISRPYVKDLPMAPYMIQLAAHYQNVYSEYFVTLVVTQPTEHEPPSAEAFQVADGAMKVDKLDLWAEPRQSNSLRFKEPILIHDGFKEEVVGSYLNLFLLALRLRTRPSRIPLHVFPSLGADPGVPDLRNHLNDRPWCPNWYALFDFNLLIFLAHDETITMDQLAQIVAAITKMEEVPRPIWKKIEARAATVVVK